MRQIDKEFWTRHRAIRDKLIAGTWIPGFKPYTGLGESLGGGGYGFNSEFTSEQMFFTLALSEHPLLDELVDSDTTWETFDAEPFVRAKVLDGFRILDLGSGPEPAYARCSRHLGAIVYTVDMHPVPHPDQEYHLQLDLRGEEEAVRKILEKTSGEFDLVTCAFLEEGDARIDAEPPENYTGTIVRLVLREGGVYRNESTLLRGTAIKKDNRL